MITSDDLAAAAEIANEYVEEVLSFLTLMDDRIATNRELLRFSALSAPTNMVLEVWMAKLKETEEGHRRLVALMPDSFPDTFDGLNRSAELFFDEAAHDIPALDLKLMKRVLAESLVFLSSHDHQDRMAVLRP